MNLHQLAEIIKETEFDKEVYFADTWEEDVPEEELNNLNCEGWWGFRKIKVFDSEALILGWIGGSIFYSTDISSYEYLQEDLKRFIEDHVGGTTEDGFVCVEIED